MEPEEVPTLCEDCFLEYMVQVTISVEMHTMGSQEDSNPTITYNFFCPRCQILKEEL